MKIWVDAGHGGTDCGAVGQNGTYESNINLEVSNLLCKMLSNNGHKIGYTRTSDKAVSLSDRAKLANEFNADLFVSVHCNSAENQNANGTESYAYQAGSKGYLRAEVVQKKLVQYLGLANRGMKVANFAVLRQTNMPAILVELAFISNTAEEALLGNSAFREKAATAIFEGVTGQTAQAESEETDVDETVMKLDNIYVQEIEPSEFGIMQCNCTKRDISIPNYFNLGFFACLGDGSTIPVGNLVVDGKVISQAKDNASWINVAGKELTTIYTTIDGQAGIVKTDDVMVLPDLKCAVSGIPIIVGGKYVSVEQIKTEGYFGNELYDTWHGFLGIRHGKLVYVAMKCGFDSMCWNLVALGIYDAIKLDGGGSFILHNGKELIGTDEDRRIDNVGVWRQ